MLLSFERPAHAGLAEDPCGPAGAGVSALLFTVLENCTVANVKRVSPGAISLRLYPKKITVKIVRAHGGCLGTKSR